MALWLLAKQPPQKSQVSQQDLRTGRNFPKRSRSAGSGRSSFRSMGGAWRSPGEQPSFALSFCYPDAGGEGVLVSEVDAACSASPLQPSLL